jgi:large conductance mechanosensitive channel
MANKGSSSVSKQIAGFMDFVRTQGVVGLAVGLAIGTQASASVKSIVEGIINPVVGFIVGNQDGLASATWNVIGKNSHKASYWFHVGDRSLVIGWGQVLSSLITLLAVAAVIFYVVKGFKLDKLDKKDEK